MYIRIIVAFLFFYVHAILLCQQSRFQPPVEKVLLILGQDLGAIGGGDFPNNDGYVDHIDPIPAGFTTYTSLSSLQGLTEPTNYGAGDVCAQNILDNPDFSETVLSIGLYLVGQLDDINKGKLDENIDRFSEWINRLNRPVFLRIGYEFNLPQNKYDAISYKTAFRYIVERMRRNAVHNVAFVWQSEGSGTKNQLEKWYPGDAYVDWLGYSHFHNKGEGILQMGREKSKPVMIAEATPQGYVLKGKNGDEAWDEWFAPLFQHVEDNKDVIQALCYINVNWDSQPMWKGQGWGDSRVQENNFVQSNWLDELSKGRWLFKSDTLFNLLQYQSTATSVLHVYEENLFASMDNKHCYFRVRSNYRGHINVYLYSILGKLISLEKFYKNDHQDEFSFAIKSDLPGVYILAVKEGNQRYTKQLLYKII